MATSTYTLSRYRADLARQSSPSHATRMQRCRRVQRRVPGTSDRVGSFPLGNIADAPKQGDEGAQKAELIFAGEFVDGLKDVHVGDVILLLTWLDRAAVMCSSCTLATT